MLSVPSYQLLVAREALHPTAVILQSLRNQWCSDYWDSPNVKLFIECMPIFETHARNAVLAHERADVRHLIDVLLSNVGAGHIPVRGWEEESELVSKMWRARLVIIHDAYFSMENSLWLQNSIAALRIVGHYNAKELWEEIRQYLDTIFPPDRKRSTIIIQQD